MLPHRHRVHHHPARLAGLALTLAAGLALGACAPHGGVRLAPGAAAEASLTVSNGSTANVQVFLVNEVRHHYLGRVESGEERAFRLPRALLAGEFHLLAFSQVGGPALMSDPLPVASLPGLTWLLYNGEGQASPGRVSGRAVTRAA